MIKNPIKSCNLFNGFLYKIAKILIFYLMGPAAIPIVAFTAGTAVALALST